MKKILAMASALLMILVLSSFEGEKQVMKTLKKENKLKKVIPTTANDGFEYYLLVTKVKKQQHFGIANKSGEIIVPVRYNEVYYFEAVTEGIKPSRGCEYCHPFWTYASEPVFLAKYSDHYSPGKYWSDGTFYKTEIFDEVSFYNLNGKIKAGPFNEMSAEFNLQKCYGDYYIEFTDTAILTQKSNIQKLCLHAMVQ